MAQSESARRHLLVLGGSSLTSLLATLVTSKVVAIVTGVAGVGHQAYILSLAVLVAGIALFGLPSSLPLWISTNRVDGSSALRSAYRLAGPMAIAAMVFGCLLALIELKTEYSTSVIITGVAMAVLASVWNPVQRAVASVVFGPNRVAVIVSVTSLGSGLGTVSTLLLLGPGALPLAIGFGLILGQVLAAITLIIFKSGQERQGDVANSITRGRLYRMSAAFFLTVSMSQLALSAIPAAVFIVASAHTAGLFRAAFSLGSLPATLLLGYVIYATYPQLVGQPRNHHSVLSKAVTSALTASTAVSVMLAVSAPISLRLAFSDDFIESSAALALIAGGSGIRILQAINSSVLMSLYKRQAMLIGEWVTGLSVLGLSAAGAILGSPLAIAAGYVLGMSIALAVTEGLLLKYRHASAIRALSASRAWIHFTLGCLLCLSMSTFWKIVV